MRELKSDLTCEIRMNWSDFREVEILVLAEAKTIYGGMYA
jgi:hypothetical protein